VPGFQPAATGEEWPLDRKMQQRRHRHRQCKEDWQELHQSGTAICPHSAGNCPLERDQRHVYQVK
jgi:hypothetical protein